MVGLESAQANTPDSRLCLEFTNTVQDHASAHPGETLQSYSDLAHWMQRVGIVSEREAQALQRRAEERPGDAALTLERAIDMREAIYRIFVALIHQQAPAAADLATLNAAMEQLSAGPGIVPDGDGFAWEWRVNRMSLDWPLWAVALSAAELLISPERERVGQCADEQGCGWLFLDTSRNRSRRWCSMGDCGNRAKQRRHVQQRQVAPRPE